MKELIPGTQSDKVVIVGQAEKKYEVKKWEIKNPHRGHTTWEINLVTGVIKAATYTEVNLEIAKLGGPANTNTVRKKILVKPDCVYLSALNIKNAIKKFAKQAQKLM